MNWFYVFVAVCALDYAWAQYTRFLNRSSMKAPIYAMALILLAGVAQIGYTHDPWLLIPAMAGAFCGTYGAMRWGK